MSRLRLSYFTKNWMFYTVKWIALSWMITFLVSLLGIDVDFMALCFASLYVFVVMVFEILSGIEIELERLSQERD